jgi:UDP-N-acetylmuramoylalanine--D-glutamate ligase
MDVMLETIVNFKGLAHRCEWVAEHEGVVWYDDSKGTNVGATLSALVNLGENTGKRVIWIAGGLAKGADFKGLKPAVDTYVKHAILMGEAAPVMAALVNDNNTLVHSMEEAVKAALASAAPGDIVLLSPACASFDMFKSFEERGLAFKNAVKASINAG